MPENDDLDPAERIAELEAQLAARPSPDDLAKAQRELAFARAGIDTTSKRGKALFATYEGDLSDTDALKAEAVEFGLLDAPAPEGTGGQPTDAEIVADLGTAERRALATGAPADTGIDEDPMARTLDEARAHMDRGAAFEKAGGHLINQRALAAMRGDQRVMFIPRVPAQVQ